MGLRDYLTVAKMTQSAFALKAGLSQGSVSRYCNGRIPKHSVMSVVVSATRGEVQPADFYSAAKELIYDR